MNVYGWKSGSRIKVNAQQAGELFEQLETVTPETVLEAAKSEDSPIHSAFEWDDTALRKLAEVFAEIDMVNRKNEERA